MKYFAEINIKLILDKYVCILIRLAHNMISNKYLSMLTCACIHVYEVSPCRVASLNDRSKHMITIVIS